MSRPYLYATVGDELRMIDLGTRRTFPAGRHNLGGHGIEISAELMTMLFAELATAYPVMARTEARSSGISDEQRESVMDRPGE